MIVFQNLIYYQILRNIWYNEDFINRTHSYKKWRLSLSLVCWKFHQYISTYLNQSFYGSIDDFGSLFLDNHIYIDSKENSSSNNKHLLFKQINSIHLFDKLYNSVAMSIDVVNYFRSLLNNNSSVKKLILDKDVNSLKFLCCILGSDLFKSVNNSNSNNKIVTNIESLNLYLNCTTFHQECSKLIESAMPLLRDLTISLADEVIISFSSICSFIQCSAFSRIKTLVIIDLPSYEETTFGDYLLNMADGGRDSNLFSGLKTLKELENLTLSLNFRMDLQDRTNADQFSVVLVDYLKSQTSLKSFHFKEDIKEGLDYLEYLFNSPICKIDQLSVSAAYSIEMMKPFKYLKLHNSCKDYSWIKMVESLEINNIIEVNQAISLLKLKPSILRFFLRVPIVDNKKNKKNNNSGTSANYRNSTYYSNKKNNSNNSKNNNNNNSDNNKNNNNNNIKEKKKNTSPKSILDAIEQNNTLNYIYIKLSNDEITKSLDKVIKNHKTIYNKETWHVKNY